MSRVQITNVDDPGCLPDIPPHQLPSGAWSNCLNVRFVDGGAERTKGYFEGYGSPAGTPRAIVQARKADGTYAWVYAHDTGIGMAVGEIHSNVGAAGTYTLAVGDKPSLLRFNDFVIANYPGRTPEYFWPIDELTDFAVLPFWPAGYKARRIIAYREFLVALGVYNGTEWEHSTVLWSHTAEPSALPDSWDIANPAKDAGAYQLGETADRLVDGVTLGGRCILYKERSVHYMEYAGYPQIFNFRPLFTDRGVLSADCVVPFSTDKGKFHLVVDRGDVYIHDGATAMSILHRRARRRWRSSLDRDHGWKTFAKHYPYQREIWVVYPTDGHTECNEVLVWNYEDNRISYRSFDKLTAIGTGYLDITDNISWDDFTGMWVTNNENWNTTVFNWNSLGTPEEWSMFASTWDSIIGDKNADHFLLAVGQRSNPALPALAFADSTGRFGTADFMAFVERVGLAYWKMDRQGRPIADIQRVKLLTEVWPRVESDGPVMVQVGAKMDEDDSYLWDPPVAFQPGLHKKVDCYISGKQLAVRFFSTQKGYWRLSGYELEIKDMGTY